MVRRATFNYWPLTYALAGITFGLVLVLVALIAYDRGRARVELQTNAEDRRPSVPVDDGSQSPQRVAALSPSSSANVTADPPSGQAAVVSSPPQELERVAATDAVLDGKQLVVRVEPAVVRVVVDRNDGRTSQGSGFILDRTTIVTNYHVIEDAKRVSVFLKGGSAFDVAGYHAISREHDLALLSVELPARVATLRLLREKPAKGEDVWAFGAPRGLEESVSKGIVSGNRTGRQV